MSLDKYINDAPSLCDTQTKDLWHTVGDKAKHCISNSHRYLPRHRRALNNWMLYFLRFPKLLADTDWEHDHH